MKKLLTGFFLCFVGSIAMNAQNVIWTDVKKSTEVKKSAATANRAFDDDSLNTDSVLDASVFIPESFEANVDSLLNSWHVQYYVKQRPKSNTYYDNTPVSDAVYKDRLSRLPRIMEMPYNQVVRNCIDLYINRKRTIEYMLGLADFYFPMIEQALDENQLPLELKYLAIVESALNPTAVSRAGATGLWQFMLPTGKAYGLEINSLVDERRDPVKATYAACRYFKDMYNIYGDWNLVIAAYNCGPGNVNKAIRRAGGKRDYWAIYNYLPRETRSYVPFFIAANYAMNYYAQHGLTPVSTSLPLVTDSIMVNELLHLGQVAQMLNIDIEMLRALNPQYKQDIIPGNNSPRPLLLPSTDVYAFISLGDSIYRYKSEEFFVNRSYVEPGEGSESQQSPSHERIVHRVRQGETVNAIANRYGVTVTQVKNWNRLKSSKVKAGTRLTLYVDNGGVRKSKQTSPNSTANSQKPKTPVSSQASGNATFTKYKVKSGDSFYTISKKYPGVSIKDLMEINKTSSAKLKVGQIIKIPTV